MCIKTVSIKLSSKLARRKLLSNPYRTDLYKSYLRQKMSKTIIKLFAACQAMSSLSLWEWRFDFGFGFRLWIDWKRIEKILRVDVVDVPLRVRKGFIIPLYSWLWQYYDNTMTILWHIMTSKKNYCKRKTSVFEAACSRTDTYTYKHTCHRLALESTWFDMVSLWVSLWVSLCVLPDLIPKYFVRGNEECISHNLAIGRFTACPVAWHLRRSCTHTQTHMAVY